MYILFGVTLVVQETQKKDLGLEEIAILHQNWTLASSVRSLWYPSPPKQTSSIFLTASYFFVKHNSESGLAIWKQFTGDQAELLQI